MILAGYYEHLLDIRQIVGAYSPTMRRTTNHLMELQNCACFNLRKTTRAITQYYDRQIKLAGLRGTQFTILAVLSETGAISITHLADFLAMDRTTVTRNLQPLKKQGFLENLTGEDQRIRNVQITEAGLKVFEEARPLWEKVQSDIIAKLGTAKFESLLNRLAETTGATK